VSYILDTLITTKGLKRSNDELDELSGAETCINKKQPRSLE
jgi:hypothetical protein